MQAGSSTYVIHEDDKFRALAALSSIGFEFAASRTVIRTLLDTFDGRLHCAGLRLEGRGVGRSELTLSGKETVAAHLVVPSLPRFCTDLPRGPFRARLATVIEVRALLPQICLTATQTDAVWLDAAGKTVAAATVYEHLRVAGQADADLPASTIEIHEVTGYGKRARRAGDAVESLGLTPLGADTLTLAATAAGIDLTGVSGSPTVPLDPTTSAVDGFRAVLANLADTITANWQGTIEQIDTEFLHDLRVAVRRTRSVLGEGKQVLPPAIVEHARQDFARLGALTGPARDLDVYLIEWDGYTGPLGAEPIAALQPVHALLEQRREAAHKALVLAMQSPEAADLRTTWLTWLHEPTREEPQGVHAGRPLGRVVVKRIARAQANLVERGRLIRPDTPPEQVHDLRKDAKKLRYLIECFGSLVADAPRKSFVRRLKAFQDNLGEHQDAEVHVAELRAMSRQLHERGASPETMVAIGQLAERLEQRRVATRAEFAERFADYDTKATERALEAMLDGLDR